MKPILHSWLSSKFVAFYIAYKKYSTIDLTKVDKKRCFDTFYIKDSVVLKELGKLSFSYKINNLSRNCGQSFQKVQ